MKKLLKILVVATLLVLTVIGFSGCSLAGNNTGTQSSAYMTTYYLDGDSEKASVTIGAEFWKDSEFKMGLYKVDGNEITFYNTDGEVAVYKGTYADGKWTVSFNSAVYSEKQVEKSGCAGSNWTNYVVFGVLILLIIGLFIWSTISNKKKQKKAEETVNSLKVGDRVKTIGGICGFVSSIDNKDNTFVLEIKADGNVSYVKFDKGAIYQTAPANGNDDEKKDKAE